MEQTKIENVFVTTWLVKNPNAVVIISHGMAEHVERYEQFASYLNERNISVYGIHQIGHGRAIKNGIKGHFDKDDFFHCVDNLHKLVAFVRLHNPNKKIYLFGHSMGSFISQYYISTYNDLDGVILCGSCGPNYKNKLNNFFAHLLFAFADNKKPGYVLNKLAFGSFNKQFAPNRTNADWISRNEEEVDKYIADDLSGFTCTVGFFKELLKGLATLKAKQVNISCELPIYIISGSKDPVGENGKGVTRLYQQYKKHGVVDCQMKLYNEGRHEILNDDCRFDVMNDVYNWITNHNDL